MNQSGINKTAAFVKSRYVDLMLSSDFALSRLGLNREQLKQDTTRSLLDVEAKAAEQKQKKQATEQEFKTYVSEFFHEKLFEYIDQRVADPDYIFSELLQYEPEVPKIFDACAAKATGATQLETLISSIPWLKAQFLTKINKPPFREERTTKPTVEEVILGVRYIGVENTKVLLLSEIAKKWLPHSTEPYSEYKLNYWRYTIATANCMRSLAPVYKLNETVAYFFGLFHGTGMSLMLRLYLRAFDTVRVAQMKESNESGRKDIEKVLDALEIDTSFVSEAVNKYTWQLSAQVFEKLGLKYAVVLPSAQEVLGGVSYDEALPMTRAILQAKTYAQYKILQQSRLIELDEAKAFLTHARINNTIISELNKVNLSRIKYSV